MQNGPCDRYCVQLRQGGHWATVSNSMSNYALAELIRSRADIRYHKV